MTSATDTTPKTFAQKLAERTPKIAAYIRLLHLAGNVFEVRALDVGQYNQTYAGFFDDADKAAEAIARLDLQEAPRGIYLTINPVQAELLCRINNRLIKVKRGETAADKHVTRRMWLFIDIDPERAGGISGIPASDEEKSIAQERSDEVADWLMKEFGWHEPMRLDSGNGCALFFPIDLPNDNDSTLLVKRVLAAIAAKWSDDKVKIDVSVCNAARIARAFLTVNRKGDSTEARPHRFCKGLHGPDYLKNGWADPIHIEKLRAVAALAPAEETRSKPQPSAGVKANSAGSNGNAGGFAHRLKVADWLAARGIEFRTSHIMADGRECWPVVCVFNSDHGFDAAVLQSPNGQLGFRCLHDSCASFGWQDAKDKIGKPDGDHYDPPMIASSSQLKDSGKPNESDDDPHRLGRLHLEAKHTWNDGTRTLAFWQGEFFEWTGLAYRPVKQHQLVASITASIKREFDRINLWILQDWAPQKEGEEPPKVKPVTKTLVNNVVNAIGSMTAQPDELLLPSWLSPNKPFEAREVLATPKRLLHLPSLIAGKSSGVSPHPHFFSTTCLDFEFDPMATCPDWISFLKSVWPDDQASIDTLQEFVGYLLVWDASQHKMLLLIGPTRSGKGTIARMLSRLLGEGNIATPTLSSLAGNFGLWSLLNKSVAIVPDARLSGREDATAVMERLLSITGEDRQDIHRKCMATLTGVRLPVRFVLMSNELPSLKDASGAFMSRVILLQMTESFLGREDRKLDDRIHRELSGILNWGIEGWKRLKARGYFIQPESANEMLEEFANLSSPIKQFISDACELGPECEAHVKILYQAWDQWCMANHRDHKGTTQAFGRDLRAAVPQVKQINRRTGYGRERVWLGIRARLDVCF